MRYQRRRAFPAVGHLAAVAAGGAVGGALRYAFVLAFDSPGGFPWVIFAENVIGAFLLGLVLTTVVAMRPFGLDGGPFLATGVLGSFTTFSNYALDVVVMGAAGAVGTALLYTFASMAAGLAAAVAGMALGHALRVPGRSRA